MSLVLKQELPLILRLLDSLVWYCQVSVAFVFIIRLDVETGHLMDPVDIAPEDWIVSTVD